MLFTKNLKLENQTRRNFKVKERSSSELMELVHTNLCGPTRTKSQQGGRYFMLLIDDYSRMTWVTFLREKSEALEKFKKFKVMVENEIDRRMKCLRSDRGGEFTYEKFNTFCENHGIRRLLSTPITPQQNGIVERMNRTIQEATRIMMNEASLPEIYWKEEIHTIVYTLNKVKIRKNHGKTSYELWYGRTLSMKIF